MVSIQAEDRKRFILQQVEEIGKVEVKELAQSLDVSTESIRQYLNQMEKERKLKKVYGGAVKISNNHFEPSLYTRENVNYKEKKRIGKEASKLVKPHDVIIIDEGSTTLQMAKHLISIEGITVITNSVAILTLLIDYKNRDIFNGEIIFLGGKIDAKNYRTTGSITENFSDQFYADHAFLATEGLSLESGLTSYSSDRGLLSKKFMECAKKITVLVDHTKFNLRMRYKISGLKGVDNIIADRRPLAEWNMDKYNINWFIASE